MHLDYDHLYIPLTSKYSKFLAQTNIFPGNINTFSIKPKKIINLFSLRSLYRRLANRQKLGNYTKTLKEHKPHLT